MGLEVSSQFHPASFVLCLTRQPYLISGISTGLLHTVKEQENIDEYVSSIAT